MTGAGLRFGGLASLLLMACAGGPGGVVTTLAEARAVEFDAVVNAGAFEGHGEDMGGYHLIVWRGGGATEKALFLSDVTDVQVLDALEALGAKPGNALSTAAWEERHNRSSWKPDQVIEGPAVTIGILLPGIDVPLELSDVLRDRAGRGFDMRLGGHRANIVEWGSGCVACLFSCPGSKVGNAAYTVRNYVAGDTRFTLQPDVLPKDGRRVRLRLSLVDES